MLIFEICLVVLPCAVLLADVWIEGCCDKRVAVLECEVAALEGNLGVALAEVRVARRQLAEAVGQPSVRRQDDELFAFLEQEIGA